MSAQQTNLVRSVVERTGHLETPAFRDPLTGRRAVEPLSRDELDRFSSVWSDGPVACIRAMNRALGLVEEPRRLTRYIEAAFDLELLMDHRQKSTAAERELVGVPSYLTDGYTDLGIRTSLGPSQGRQKILVDKERLRPDLVCTKRRALQDLGKWEARAVELEAVLRRLAQSLRESAGYDEGGAQNRARDATVRLSESIAERSVGCRHLAILFQLRLQEAGLSSRLVKGKLQLYSLKLKHAWNMVREGEICALVDAAFGEEEAPFVLVGNSPAEVYGRAAELSRLYNPSPDEFHRYQIRGP
jgi:hypothetical protein